MHTNDKLRVKLHSTRREPRRPSWLPGKDGFTPSCSKETCTDGSSVSLCSPPIKELRSSVNLPAPTSVKLARRRPKEEVCVYRNDCACTSRMNYTAHPRGPESLLLGTEAAPRHPREVRRVVHGIHGALRSAPGGSYGACLWYRGQRRRKKPVPGFRACRFPHLLQAGTSALRCGPFRSSLRRCRPAKKRFMFPNEQHVLVSSVRGRPWRALRPSESGPIGCLRCRRWPSLGWLCCTPCTMHRPAVSHSTDTASCGTPG